MEVLHFGYLVPFHQLPPGSQEALEFPPPTFGSAKALALQGEADKMLEKGALELVDHRPKLLQSAVYGPGWGGGGGGGGTGFL